MVQLSSQFKQDIFVTNSSMVHEGGGSLYLIWITYNYFPKLFKLHLETSKV